MLQYNKLYQSLKKVGGEWHAGHFQWYYYWNYIKFYEDGTLIYCASSEDDFNNINKWFNKDNENVSIGTYKITNNANIKMEITAAIGRIINEGGIYPTAIIVKSKNPKNQYELLDSYELRDI
jgi:hypothetical protein